VNQNQVAFLLGKAKKMARDGAFPAEEFKEVQLSLDLVELRRLYFGVRFFVYRYSSLWIAP